MHLYYFLWVVDIGVGIVLHIWFPKELFGNQKVGGDGEKKINVKILMG